MGAWGSSLPALEGLLREHCSSNCCCLVLPNTALAVVELLQCALAPT